MAQKKDIPILQIIILLAVIVAAVYLVKTYVLKPKTETSNDTPPTSSTSTGSSAVNTPPPPAVSTSGLPIKGNDTVLKRGDKAVEVKYIQYEYNKNFAEPLNKEELEEDGIFGAKTEQAVLSIVNKKSTSYKEFKEKLDEANNPIGFEDFLPSWF